MRSEEIMVWFWHIQWFIIITLPHGPFCVKYIKQSHLKENRYHGMAWPAWHGMQIFVRFVAHEMNRNVRSNIHINFFLVCDIFEASIDGNSM